MINSDSPPPRRRHRLHLVALLLALPVACGDDSAKTPPVSGPAKTIPASYWSATDLPEARPVAEVRKAGKVGEEVVLVGRVKDFVDSRAVFTLIDAKLKSCRETEDDKCPTPWDYCCVEPDVVAKNTVTVEIAGDDGRPLRTGLKGYHGIDHLQTVAVRGKLQRDSSGNVTVSMSALHRR